MSKTRVLAIIEDDETFSRTLARSFERRGYEVHVAASHEALTALLATTTPTHAVVDLKLAGASGLTCVASLNAHHASMRIVVLTGFASIATAVESIKLGACHYLAKPANTDDIEAAFDKVDGDVEAPVGTRTTSLKNLEWERIHETLVDAEFNISEAARRLGMHRRTLARKLEKRRIK